MTSPTSKFVFGSPTHTFCCALNTRLCGQATRRGHGPPCRRKVTHGVDACYTHRKEVYGVYVANSTIPGAGKGLFAARAFDANEYIMKYNGETLTEDQLNRRYGPDNTAPYTVKVGRDTFTDAACVRTLVGYANHPSHGNRANCIFAIRVVNGTREVWLRVKPNLRVRAGDEILVNYGGVYEINQRGTCHETYNGRRCVPCDYGP